MHVLALALALIAADEPITPLDTSGEGELSTTTPNRVAHPTPVWLPRGASLGVFVNAPMVTPNIRLQWDINFYEFQHDALLGVIMIGTGIGLADPSPMTLHVQSTALAGVGYRNTRATWQWGFQLGLGPVWYLANYLPNTNNPENRVIGYAEGRLQAGLRLQPHFVLGLYFGFASPWNFNYQVYPGNTFIGGFSFGLYADWR